MTRTITQTQTLYHYDELSDEAKEHARQWWLRDYAFDAHEAEHVIDDAKHVAKLIGIDITDVYYSGFYSQGDGACFEGAYYYAKGATAKVTEYAPEDKALQRVARDLQEAQRPRFYALSARVVHRGHYSHSGCTDIEVYDNESFAVSEDTETDAIKQALRDFMDWIYQQLEGAYEFAISEENVAENIRINEYEFTEDGDRSEF